MKWELLVVMLMVSACGGEAPPRAGDPCPPEGYSARDAGQITLRTGRAACDDWGQQLRCECASCTWQETGCPCPTEGVLAVCVKGNP